MEGSSDFIWWHPGETGLASWKRTQAERHFRWQLRSCHASVPGCCPWTMTGFCERVRQLVSPCRPSFYNPSRHVGMTFSKIHFRKSGFWHLYKNIPTFCRSFQMWRTWEKPWRGSSAEVKGAEFGWETIHVFRGVPASQKIAMTFFLTALIDNCAPACCTSRIFMTAVIWVERSVFKQGSSRLSSRMFKSRMRKLQNLKECTEWPSDFRSSVTVFPHST